MYVFILLPRMWVEGGDRRVKAKTGNVYPMMRTLKFMLKTKGVTEEFSESDRRL